MPLEHVNNRLVVTRRSIIRSVTFLISIKLIAAGLLAVDADRARNRGFKQMRKRAEAVMPSLSGHRRHGYCESDVC